MVQRASGKIRERVERREVECESIIPTERQRLAFEAPETFILYGGAMGGGKTTWLAAYAVELSMRYRGNVGYLCRHELRSFKRTTLRTLLEHMPWELVAQHHRTENFIRFKNGSVLFYGGLGDDERAIDRLKSMELGWFGIDQAEETTEKFFFMLSTRLRLKTRWGLRYKGLLTANPEPNWIKARFIDQNLSGHAFIPALPRDNPYLPKGYVERIQAMDIPDELKRAWLEGDWDALSQTNTIFPAKEVLEAMQRSLEPRPEDELTYGLDVADYGGDESVLSCRRGLAFSIVGAWAFQDPMETVGKTVRALDYDKSRRINIDAIGVGSGVYSRLKELGYNAHAIKGSNRPTQKNRLRYKNYRTELHFNLRSLLPYCSLPNDPALRSQLTSIRYRVLSTGLIAVETKDELRARGLPSPDRMESILYAAASTEEAEDEAFVWHAGMREEARKPEQPRQRRLTYGRPQYNQRPKTRKELEEEWENDDEGKIFIA